MMPYLSLADLGGRLDTRRIEPEPEGVHFHADWEPRVLALTLAMGATGQWNIDMSRRTRETLPDYPRLSYYALWFEALCRLLVERGLVTEQELQSGHSSQTGRALSVLHAGQVEGVLRRGSPAQRPPVQAARFAVGDVVVTRREPADHHTRLPAYARGRKGRIEAVHGAHVLADRHADGLGEQPTWLYRVSFLARNLWPEASERNDRVHIDAWETYLEKVS